MAGLGSRFTKAGYTEPKPLIPIRGKPMIQWVVDSLRNLRGQYIFCVLQEHLDKYNLYERLNQIAPKCSIVPVPALTQGAVNTCLLAESIISPSDTLIISNSDQISEFNAADLLTSLFYYEGFILNFNSTDPKWSYVLTNKHGKITRVVEKEVVSDIANVGIYGWSNASYFFDSARTMIENNDRVNGEFYIAPTYNVLLSRGFRIQSIMCQKMLAAGTPEDLEETSKLL
jgi:dTDP-glucose pyrophosphorylase